MKGPSKCERYLAVILMLKRLSVSYWGLCERLTEMRLISGYNLNIF